VILLEHTIKRLNGLVIKRPGMAFGLWGEAGIGKTHAVQIYCVKARAAVFRSTPQARFLVWQKLYPNPRNDLSGLKVCSRNSNEVSRGYDGDERCVYLTANFKMIDAVCQSFSSCASRNNQCLA
jgi:hypothetical protein